jgi:hypothetical protein
MEQWNNVKNPPETKVSQRVRHRSYLTAGLRLTSGGGRSCLAVSRLAPRTRSSCLEHHSRNKLVFETLFICCLGMGGQPCGGGGVTDLVVGHEMHCEQVGKIFHCCPSVGWQSCGGVTGTVTRRILRICHCLLCHGSVVRKSHLIPCSVLHGRRVARR